MALASLGAFPHIALATTPSKVEPGDLVDNKYLWCPSFAKTQVEPSNASYPFAFLSECLTKDDYLARKVYGHRYSNQSQLSRIANCAIRWSGGEYLDGTAIDMVMKVTGYSPNWRAPSGVGADYNYFYATTVGELNPYHEQLKPGIIPGAPLFEFCGFAYIDLQFNFYEAGTETPIKLAGHTSLSDVDWGEQFGFDGVDSIFISNANNFISINGDLVQAEVGERESLEQTTASIYFDCESFTLRYYGNPWKIGLCCFDSSSISTITPPDPEKSYVISD